MGKTDFVPGVCVWLFAGLCGQSAHAQKVPDTKVDAAAVGVTSTDPEIAVSGDSVYLVWEDDRSSALNDVFFNRSLDSGNSWLGADTQINTNTGSAGSRDPEVAASGASVYVAWDGDGGVRFNRSTDRGSNWGAVDTLAAANAANPLLAATGSFVYLVYQKPTTFPFGNDLYFARSLDSGATWQPEVRIDTDVAGAGESATPKLAIAGSGVYVAWRDHRSGLADVYFNGSSDNGATWLAADVRLDTGVAAGSVEAYFSVEIAAADNNVYVIWWDDRSAPGEIKRDVFANCSNDNGMTWNAAGTRLNTDGPGLAESHFPHVAASGSSAWVVWAEFRDGDGDVYLQRTIDGGATWLASDIRIDNAPAGFHSGVLEIAAAGSTVVVGFQDNRQGGILLFSQRSVDGGFTWLPNDVLVASSAGVVGASLQGIAISDESAYLVWDDSRDGDCDIYFNIPVGVQAYGVGKAGSGGFVPVVSATGQPAIGNTVSIDVANGLGGASGALLIGGPGTKAAIPLLGGTILMIPQFAPPFVVGGAAGVPGAGVFGLPLGIPFDAALVGAVLYFQPVLVDPGASFGLSMCNAIELWVG